MKINLLFSLILPLSILTIGTINVDAAPTVWSAEATTGAATGYCLAKHPYATLHRGNNFTPDGYEIVAPPGIVGAVRRNYIYNRTATKDEGIANSCSKACSEFGKPYEPTFKGFPLQQQVKVDNNQIIKINSGLGDIASLAVPDKDYSFHPPKTVTAGIWSRGNTFHEVDVAQADYCCCQAK